MRSKKDLDWHIHFLKETGDIYLLMDLFLSLPLPRFPNLRIAVKKVGGEPRYSATELEKIYEKLNFDIVNDDGTSGDDSHGAWTLIEALKDKKKVEAILNAKKF